MSLSLPADLVKNGKVRTANTADDYWTLFYQGFVPENSAAASEQLSPQQKAARTKAANKAKEEAETSSEGDADTVGTATDGEGPLTDAQS